MILKPPDIIELLSAYGTLRRCLLVFVFSGYSILFAQNEGSDPPENGFEPKVENLEFPDEDGPLKKNIIGLRLGYRGNKSQDLVYSPMIYKGGALGVSISYQRNTRNGFHILRLSYDQAKVESSELITFPVSGGSITRESSTATFINIQYGYGRQVLQKSPYKLAIGGILDSQAHLTDYLFGLSDDTGYILAYSLSYFMRGEYLLDDKQSFLLEASFPLLSFVVRPTYAIVDNNEIQNEGSDLGYIHGNGQLEGPGQYVKLLFVVDYKRTLSPRTDLIVGYQFQYLKNNDPLRISLVKNSIDVGLNFKF